MGKTPIINSIIAALDEKGNLPLGFHLPDEEVAPEMRFLDGAEDGVRLYHMKPRPVDLTPYTAALYEIKSGSSKKAERALRKAIRQDHERFVRMIDVMGPLQEWMGNHPNVMKDEAFLRFALTQLAASDDREMIKFALALLSNYTLDEKGQIPKMIRVLALSDEFTFPCVVMMKDWKEGNEEIFEVAKRVRGWGRIHAVHYLEPQTAAIRRWMLTQGCRNDVRAAYSARDLAVKLPLVRILTDQSLSQEEFDGISVIMEALMDEKTAPGISTLREGDILMDVYLKQAEGRMLTREGVSAVSCIRKMRGETDNSGPQGGGEKDGRQA